jgi:hypothetical protein
MNEWQAVPPPPLPTTTCQHRAFEKYPILLPPPAPRESHLLSCVRKSSMAWQYVDLPLPGAPITSCPNDMGLAHSPPGRS